MSSSRTCGDWSPWDSVLLPQVMAPRARVLIDGRSGSGKSTLAARLVELAAAAGVSVHRICLEDIYPGWDGLAAATQILVDDLLRPLHDHGSGSWQQWDWQAGRSGETHLVDAAQPIMIEGVGSLSRASAPLATYRVWVAADAAERRRRALARDGELYRPHWERWAAQEELFIARHEPSTLADLVIDAPR